MEVVDKSWVSDPEQLQPLTGHSGYREERSHTHHYLTYLCSQASLFNSFPFDVEDLGVCTECQGASPVHSIPVLTTPFGGVFLSVKSSSCNPVTLVHTEQPICQSLPESCTGPQALIHTHITSSLPLGLTIDVELSVALI